MYLGRDATVSILTYWNLFLIVVIMPAIRVITIKAIPLSRIACSSIIIPPVELTAHRNYKASLPIS